MKNILIVILVLGATCMWACSKDLPDAGGTATEALSNEWWATEDGADVSKISTYNTSSNEDSMWISAANAPNAFRVKVKVDPSSLTFSGQNSKNFISNLINTVNITNGKVIRNGGKSLEGNITDSIYMEAEYSNDPGVKHILTGVARTKFIEDDY